MHSRLLTLMVSMNRYVPKLGVRGSSPLGIANLFAYNVVVRVRSILNKRSNGRPAPGPTTVLDLPPDKDRVEHSAHARFFPHGQIGTLSKPS